MKIGEVADKAGVGVETVRFYERKHMIEQPRKPANGGYRDYPEEAAVKIKFIRQAQHLGFSLREVKDLLSLKADPSTDCSEIRKLAAVKRQEVIDKIEHLNQIRGALDAVIDACPGDGNIRACSIIEEMERG